MVQEEKNRFHESREGSCKSDKDIEAADMNHSLEEDRKKG